MTETLFIYIFVLDICHQLMCQGCRCLTKVSVHLEIPLATATVGGLFMVLDKLMCFSPLAHSQPRERLLSSSIVQSEALLSSALLPDLAVPFIFAAEQRAVHNKLVQMWNCSAAWACIADQVWFRDSWPGSAWFQLSWFKENPLGVLIVRQIFYISFSRGKLTSYFPFIIEGIYSHL